MRPEVPPPAGSGPVSGARRVKVKRCVGRNQSCWASAAGEESSALDRPLHFGDARYGHATDSRTPDQTSSLSLTSHAWRHRWRSSRGVCAQGVVVQPSPSTSLLVHRPAAEDANIRGGEIVGPRGSTNAPYDTARSQSRGRGPSGPRGNGPTARRIIPLAQACPVAGRWRSGSALGPPCQERSLMQARPTLALCPRTGPSRRPRGVQHPVSRHQRPARGGRRDGR
jgi:hypothetical protein